MKAKMIGSGWHGQSLRHRNARLKGRAGGQYLSNMPVGVVKKNLDGKTSIYKLEKVKDKRMFGDSDTPLGTAGDAESVMMKENQDSRLQMAEEQAIANEPLDLSVTTETAEKESKKYEKGIFEKITDKINEEVAEKNRQREKKFEANREKVSEIIKKKIDNEEEINVKTLSDNELRQLSILRGKGFWGDNEYESELKRRIREEVRLRTDLELESKQANEKRAERIYKEDKVDDLRLSKAKKQVDEDVKSQEEGGGEGFFEWLLTPPKSEKRK